MTTAPSRIVLPADSNQALGIGRYTAEFMNDDSSGAGGQPDAPLLERTTLFHTAAVLCGASALALGANSPAVLRNEALQYRATPAGTGSMACVLGSGRHEVRRGGATV